VGIHAASRSAQEYDFVVVDEASMLADAALATCSVTAFPS
jgi:hypothetical protein